MYQIDSFYDFQRFIDEEGTISFFENSSDLNDYNFGKYIKYQFIFFCIGALVTIASVSYTHLTLPTSDLV